MSATTFFQLFRGNPDAHYVRSSATSKYEAVHSGITLADVERHLRGDEPSVLSIPILPNGQCYFGAIDIDVHDATDTPVDHAALARRVTELGLPLVVCLSKGGHGAWLFLFLKEEDGFSAATVRLLLEKYVRVLGITQNVDIFPRQDNARKTGNGLNLPYFGESRVAFGKDGRELSLEDFLPLAQERAAFGMILAARDLSGEPQAADLKDSPALTESAVRRIHKTNLDKLRKAVPGSRNNLLNEVCFFAGRAFAAAALDGTEEQIKKEIQTIAREIHLSESEIHITAASGWNSGIAQPLTLAQLDIEKELDRLARLPNHEYETQRKEEAKRLGMRPAALDKEIYRRRKLLLDENPDDDLGIVSTVPWTDAVDGEELLDSIVSTLKRFIIFPHEKDVVQCALWVCGTHCYEEFDIFPRMNITAISSGCGKTSLLRIMDNLSNRTLASDDLSPAYLFRAIEAGSPLTIVVDELDSFLKEQPTLIGVLNSGHKKGGFVGRVEKEGERQVPRRFKTFAPVLYGMIGRPKGTLSSRSLYVRLLRKKPSDITEDFDTTEYPELEAQVTVIRRKIAKWVGEHRLAIRDSKPDTKSLANRNRDNWRPLLKIASVVSQEWLRKASNAAGIESIEYEDSLQIKLLRDINNIFYTRDASTLPSAVLVGDLARQTESPWATYRNGHDAMNANDLAELLRRDLGIFSEDLSINKDDQKKLFNSISEKKVVRKGYRREQFRKLIEHQLAGEEPEKVETSPMNVELGAS